MNGIFEVWKSQSSAETLCLPASGQQRVIGTIENDLILEAIFRASSIEAVRTVTHEVARAAGLSLAKVKAQAQAHRETEGN